MRQAGGRSAANVQHEPHAGADEGLEDATPYGDADLADGDGIA
jgi:hypothetical protein